MSLDLTSLENAVKQLEEVLELHDSISSEDDPLLKKYIRTATIKTFEFTYETTFKMLKRHLEGIAASPETIRHMTFSNIIREAYSQDVVCSDITIWRKYRENRGITSHTYNEDKAQKIFLCARDFLHDVRYTLFQLQKGNEPID